MEWNRVAVPASDRIDLKLTSGSSRRDSLDSTSFALRGSTKPDRGCSIMSASQTSPSTWNDATAEELGGFDRNHVARLYVGDPVARLLLDHFAAVAPEKASYVNSLESLLIRKSLSEDFPAPSRRQIVDVLQELEQAGCGEYWAGKHDWSSRFNWSVDSNDVGRLAAEHAGLIDPGDLVSTNGQEVQAAEGGATVSSEGAPLAAGGSADTAVAGADLVEAASFTAEAFSQLGAAWGDLAAEAEALVETPVESPPSSEPSSDWNAAASAPVEVAREEPVAEAVEAPVEPAQVDQPEPEPAAVAAVEESAAWHSEPVAANEPGIVASGAAIVDEESENAAYLEHSFQLRPGLRITLTLPTDLTRSEARRLAIFLKSLPFQD
jgi:hypothetical protein